MKQAITLICMLIFPLRVFAPGNEMIDVPETEAINPFENLISAVIEVESQGDSLAYNTIEQAYGIMQIRPIRLLDYNQRTGKRYKLQDCYKPSVSREIFLYYAAKIGPYDLSKVAKSWNGSGPDTEIYWLKIHNYLNQ